jgi:hypothetical protein
MDDKIMSRIKTLLFVLALAVQLPLASATVNAVRLRCGLSQEILTT